VSDDETARVRCPLGDCREPWLDYAALFEHLLRHPHKLDGGEANRLNEIERRRLERGRLGTGREAMWDWSLRTYPADDLAGRRALRLAKAWFDEPRDLFVHGPTGVGKTGLVYGIAQAWLAIPYDDPSEDVWLPEVEWVNLRTLLDEQKAAWARRESGPLGRLFDDSHLNRLTVLDDLGADRPTEWVVEQIEKIVERLHDRRALTITTSNYSPSDLAERLGRENPIAGERIVSRLIEGATLLRIERSNLRLALHDLVAEDDW
jgi:DNA replication protein DnaC